MMMGLSEQEAARLTALYEYGILDTPAEAVFDSVTQLAAQICEVPIALLGFMDIDRLVFKSMVGLDAIEMPRHKSMCHHTLACSDVLVVVDASGNERFIGHPLGATAPSIRFYAGVPLIDPKGYRLGTLCVMDYVPQSLNSQQKAALRSLAQQTLLLLEQRRKIHGLEQAVAQGQSAQMRIQLQLQYVVTHVLAEAATLNEATPRLLQTICDYANWDFGELWIVDRAANLIHCQAHWSRVASQFKEFSSSSESWVFAPGCGLPGRVWSTRQPLWMSDVVFDKLFLRSHIAAKVGLHAAMGCPILSHDRVVGVMTFFSEQVQSPNEEMMTTMMAAIASQVGQFIERKHAEEEAQRQNARSQLFAAIMLKIRRSLHLNEILETTVLEVRQFLQADRVMIYRFDRDGNGTVMVESVKPGWSSVLDARFQDVCFQDKTWQCYRQGQPVVIHDLEIAPLTPYCQRLLRQYEVKAKLVVPILQDRDGETEPQLWGLLIAHQCGSPRQWQPFEVEFLMQLADQVAIALMQARLLEQERRQRSRLAEQNLALQQAREEAERASQLKSRFLTILSQEIRTPMSAMLSMTELLLDTDLNSPQRKIVESIRASGDNLLTLINQVLDFSQLEAGEIELETLEFDLRTCLERVADWFAPAAFAKGLEIAALIRQDVPIWVQGDGSRLQQILTNLVCNAIAFTQQGEVLIAASLVSQTETAATIRFSVTDTRMGMFHPCTQADASMTDQSSQWGGRELGLAISHQLVELMGGMLNVERQSNTRSTFWFTLTLAKKSQLNLAQAGGYGAALHETLNLAQVRLLIVDDNAMNRAIVRDQVSAWGIEVEEAESAAIALEKFRDRADRGIPYDLAILGMQLPEIDGKMLAGEIKADPALAHTKLILLTAAHGGDSADAIAALGFSAHLIKPVIQPHLRDCLLDTIRPAAAIEKNVSAAVLLGKTNTKLKILLVENNAANQKVILNQLQQLGYTADVAANGKEAIEMLKQIPYNLVLMDCQMPGLDGYDATRLIRSQRSHRQSTIIALSANAMREDRDRCLAAGMDDYLSQPISKEKLREKLAYWGEWLEQQAVKQTMNLAIDWEHLHQLSDQNEAFERELLQIFAEDTQQHLDAARTALEHRDATSLSHAAHHIKGSSANVGLYEMKSVASMLEKQALTHELTQAPVLMAQLVEMLEVLRQFLDSPS